MGHLAQSLSAQWRLVEAYKLQEQLLELRKQVLGERHPYTLADAMTLGETLHRLGKLEAALHQMQYTLVLMTEVLGEGHQYTIACKSSLENLLKVMAKFEDVKSGSGGLKRWFRKLFS